MTWTVPECNCSSFPAGMTSPLPSIVIGTTGTCIPTHIGPDNRECTSECVYAVTSKIAAECNTKLDLVTDEGSTVLKAEAISVIS